MGGDRYGRHPPLALTLAAVAGAAGLAVCGLTRFPELRADHGTPIWIIVLAVRWPPTLGSPSSFPATSGRMPP